MLSGVIQAPKVTARLPGFESHRVFFILFLATVRLAAVRLAAVRLGRCWVWERLIASSSCRFDTHNYQAKLVWNAMKLLSQKWLEDGCP